MLKGFDEDIAGLEGLSDELKAQLIEMAGNRANGILNKNAELLQKLAGKGGQDGELEQLRQFKANAELSIAEEAKNYREAKELLESTHAAKVGELEQQIEALTTQNAELVTANETRVLETELKDALDAVRVKPGLKDGAFLLLSRNAKIKDGKAVINDKSLSEAVKEWADTDQGKEYTLAANNSGAGVNGSGEPPAGGGKWSDYNAGQLSAIRRENPQEYERLRGTREQ